MLAQSMSRIPATTLPHFARNFARPGMRETQSDVAPYSEDEESLLRSLGRKSLSGLGWIGGSLDKALGGRAIRAVMDMLVGGDADPTELLSIIPFSDTLGITDPENSVEGRKLLEDTGLLSANREGFSPLADPADALGDILGFGAEVLLDPGSYLSFGALSRAGQAAKRAGVLPAKMGDRVGKTFLDLYTDLGRADDLAPRPLLDEPVRQTDKLAQAVKDSGMEWKGPRTEAGAPGAIYDEDPIAGLVGVGMPFFKPSFVLGTGPRAQRVAKAVSAAGEYIKGGRVVKDAEGWRDATTADEAAAAASAGSPSVHEAPSWLSAPARTLKGLFDPTAGDLATHAGQQAHAKYAKMAEADEAAINSQFARGAQEIGAETMLDATRADRLRKHVEGTNAVWNQADRNARHAIDSSALANDAAMRSSLHSLRERLVLGDAPLGDVFRMWNEVGDEAARDLLKETVSRQTGRAVSDPLVEQAAGVLQESLAAYRPVLGELPATAERRAADMGLAAMRQAEESLRDLGRSPRDFSSQHGTQYWPRQMTELDQHTRGFGSSTNEFLPKDSPSSVQRNPLFDIPGGTSAVNRLETDAATVGMNALQLAEHIRRNYLGMTAERADALRATAEGLGQQIEQASSANRLAASLPADEAAALQQIRAAASLAGIEGDRLPAFVQRMQDARRELAELRGQKQSIEETLSKAQSHSRDLAEHLIRNRDPRRVTEQVGLFSNHPLEDMRSKLVGDVRARAGLESTYEMLAGTAREAATARPGDVPLSQLVRTVTGNDDIGAFYRNITRHNPELPQGVPLERLFVPQEVAGDVARVIRGFQAPEAASQVVDLFDKFTNLFKTGVTTIWPGFHVRNFATGAWMNWVTGAFSHSSYADAWELMQGRVPSGLRDLPMFKAGPLAELDDLAAAQELAAQAFGHRVTGGGQVAEVVGKAQGVGATRAAVHPSQRAAAQTMAGIPGLAPDTPWEAIKDLRHIGEGFNPLEVAGVKGDIDRFVPAQTGRRIGKTTEDLNRLAGWIELQKQGYAPAAAAERMRSAHVDYRQLTPTERNVFRRLIPFYSFTRRMLPEQLREIVQRPGGKVGTTIKASTANERSGEGFTPEYLKGGLAIPVWQGEDGRTTYLTQLDLPHEQFNMLHFGERGLTKTGLDMLGMLNPILKGPMELATGRQFYSDRDLRDLDPRSGRILEQLGLIDNPRDVPLLLEQALMNSPASRLLTTTGNLLDDRKTAGQKAVNLLTGLRLSDVDMEKQKEIEARRMIGDLLRQSGAATVFENISVGDPASLTPEERQLAALSQSLARRARERKRAESAAGQTRRDRGAPGALGVP